MLQARLSTRARAEKTDPAPAPQGASSPSGEAVGRQLKFPAVDVGSGDPHKEAQGMHGRGISEEVVSTRDLSKAATSI